MSSTTNPSKEPLEMWGGIECTVNRVRDAYHTQLDRNGHDARNDDLERFAALGIRSLRYPVLWERTAPDGLGQADWRFADERLPALQRLGIKPIVGLVHHGSGPRHTSLLDPGFAAGLAEFAGAVAARYPWVEDWTPVNEPVTTARFSCLYGTWYPHARDDRSFVAAMLNQCRATVLSMEAIRRVNPRARLVQTDDLSRTYGTAPTAERVAFYNARRWLSWDLLCGHVTESHPLWRYLTANEAKPADLHWFVDHACPPDVLGINYYVTSDRWLDHRLDRYPERTHGGPPHDRFVDIEAVRVMAHPKLGIAPLLEEAWERYGIPIAVTEAHIDARREDQLRWLYEIWQSAHAARRAGADVRAVTAWSLLGSFDWNCLLGECRGYYEPGPFDVRSAPPRATALAGLITELAAGRKQSHSIVQAEGWWRRADRFIAEPTSTRADVARLSGYRPEPADEAVRPILISGATGSLGKAFAILCGERNLPFKLLGRSDMDIADPASVAAALARWRPWAVVNASGYVRIDEAESDVERCFRENAIGPAVLAEQCASAGVRLLTFSSDQVFDGRSSRPWLEHDRPAPLNCYGRSKAAAEQSVLAAWPEAMVVRTSAFFGPWDRHNFLVQALDAIESGRRFSAAEDERVSPTYLPDLVNVSLDLLIDGERGIWHLANVGDVSWFEFAARACSLAGIDAGSLVPCRSDDTARAVRPRYAVLASERGALMPPLDGALAHFVQMRANAAAATRREPARLATRKDGR
jgi:dTDP-4-dehydrorhamnose reductase